MTRTIYPFFVFQGLQPYAGFAIGGLPYLEQTDRATVATEVLENQAWEYEWVSVFAVFSCIRRV